jgi:hypothetical protein
VGASKLVPLSELFSYFNSFTKSQKALNCIKNLDIVGLVETHTTSKKHIKMSLDVLNNLLLSLTKSATRFSLSIGVWNVNGLVSKDFDKLNDVSFLNCIKNLDIVGYKYR